jgi:predicted nucleic acid-binding protein
MILIDTGPLVGLCDETDQHNKAAVRDFKRLAGERFAVCTPVVAEAFFHLPGAFHRERLKTLTEQMRAQALTLEDPDGWDQLFEWFERYAEHEPDFADGYLAVLCGRDPKLAVWTYDREFATIWRRPDGTRIPLASNADG